MQLVGFIIRIHHDARSCERQIRIRTNNRVLFIISLPISFHEICCSLIFYFVTMHSVHYVAHAAGQSNATSSGALHEQRVQPVLVRYSQCLYGTAGACTVQPVLVRYSRCLYGTVGACTVRSVLVRYNQCLYPAH